MILCVLCVLLRLKIGFFPLFIDPNHAVFNCCNGAVDGGVDGGAERRMAVGHWRPANGLPFCHPLANRDQQSRGDVLFQFHAHTIGGKQCIVQRADVRNRRRPASSSARHRRSCDWPCNPAAAD